MRTRPSALALRLQTATERTLVVLRAASGELVDEADKIVHRQHGLGRPAIAVGPRITRCEPFDEAEEVINSQDRFNRVSVAVRGTPASVIDGGDHICASPVCQPKRRASAPYRALLDSQ